MCNQQHITILNVISIYSNNIDIGNLDIIKVKNIDSDRLN